jgi:hypothetical protein
LRDTEISGIKLFDASSAGIRNAENEKSSEIDLGSSNALSP